MQTTYLDHRDLRIEFEDGSIVLLEKDGQRLGTLSGKNLERLILQGEILCSTGAIRHLLEQGTSVLWLSARNSHQIASLHGKLHGDAQIRLQQYRCYEDPAFRLGVARRMIRSKLQGQQRQIAQWLGSERTERKCLMQAQEAITQGIDALGQAAHAYFQALFTQVLPGLSSTVRSRRPPRDPVNVLLFLGYTMAHHEAVSVAYAAGLDPISGFCTRSP